MNQYQYLGKHHTRVVLIKGQPKVRVEPKETVETVLTLPKKLFALVQEDAPKANKNAQTKQTNNNNQPTDATVVEPADATVEASDTDVQVESEE